MNIDSKILFLSFTQLLLLLLLSSIVESDSICLSSGLASTVAMAAPGSVQKGDEEWRAILSPEQFRILRQKGTE